MIFTGDYEHTIDSKNRVSIPARFRQMLSAETIGDKFYLIIGPNRKLWLYPNKYYEQLVANCPRELIPDSEFLKYEEFTFGLARLVEPDKTGRFIIPEKMMERTGLGKDVVIVGVRDHIELWNRNEWEEFIEKGLSEHNQMLSRARMTWRSSLPPYNYQTNDQQANSQ